MTGWADTCGQGTSWTARRESHPPRSPSQSRHPAGRDRRWDHEEKRDGHTHAHKKIIIHKTQQENRVDCEPPALPAVHQLALMVERGRRDFSLHHPDPWDAANVATQEVAAEHVAEGDDKDKTRLDKINFINPKGNSRAR